MSVINSKECGINQYRDCLQNFTDKGENLVAAISSLNPYMPSIDSEYMRILMELHRLGISPSGNKSVDKAKLEQAKAELITKIQNKEKENHQAALGVQTIDPVEDNQNAQRAEMEEQRLGAMTVAELNRLYFGI